MDPDGQFFSPIRQVEIRPYETAIRPLVGYAKDYPNGLIAGRHSHPRAQLLFGITGVMRVDVQSCSFVVPPTTALLVPANRAHSISMEGAVAMRCLFLRSNVARLVGDDVRLISVSPLLRELVIAACHEPLNWDLDGRGYHICELAINEIQKASPLPISIILPKDPRVLRIAQALRTNPSDFRTLEDWSEICGASSRTLTRLFMRETGLTFQQWRLQARLTQGFSLLVTDGNIARVAALVGFKSQSAFGAAFREAFGLTPGQARALGSK